MEASAGNASGGDQNLRITAAGRKIYSTEFKKKLAAEVKAGKSAADVGRAHGVRAGAVGKWARGEQLNPPRRDPATGPRKIAKHPKNMKGGKSLRDRFQTIAMARLEKGKTPLFVADKLGIEVKHIYHWRSQLKKGVAARGDQMELRRGRVGKHNLKMNGLGVPVGMGAPPHAVTSQLPAQVRDAVSLLKHAEAAIYTKLNSGAIKKLGHIEMLVLQALQSLTGSE